jgi:hypothetical protein
MFSLTRIELIDLLYFGHLVFIIDHEWNLVESLEEKEEE